MRFFENLKNQVIIIILAELVTAYLLYVLKWVDIAYGVGATVIINAVILLWVVYTYEKNKNKVDADISRELGDDAKNVLEFADIGVLVYDENYTVVALNDFFANRNIELVGKKLASWIPQTKELFTEGVEEITASDAISTFRIARVKNSHILYVSDIGDFVDLQQRYTDEQSVAGLIQLDNYNEILQYEDEAKVAKINLQVRQLVLTWAKENNILIRTLRPDRFLVMMSARMLDTFVEQKFPLLAQIREASEAIEESITLSMAFASGTSDYGELDRMINDLLELAQSRGGDQVALKRFGEDVHYFGGNSQAVEKRSKVRVRVISQAMKEAMQESERIFVVGHHMMDFDCMSAMLGVSRIGQSNGVKTFIISEGLEKDYQLENAFNEYLGELKDRHTFISEDEALKMARSNDLIVVVDHNNPNQCSIHRIFEQVNRVIVLDHHRRSEAIFDNTILLYVETSASSSTELVSELFPYQGSKIVLSEEEAMLMYLGLLVDTNHFTNRTGSRTFETAALLRRFGADPLHAVDFLKEDYVDFELKASIMKEARRIHDNVMVAPIEGVIVTRTMLSQCADELLDIKGMEASFVIGQISEHEVAISARSKTDINVQRIMEKMQGGGHFNAAALQRQETSVQELYDELINVLDTIEEEETNHESNPIE